MTRYEIAIFEEDIFQKNTTEIRMLDNYLIEDVDAESEEEAVALYADWFFRDQLHTGHTAELKANNEVIVNGEYRYWFRIKDEHVCLF